MDQFKIEHFRSTYRRDFPSHRMLSKAEAREIRARLATNAGLEHTENLAAFTTQICALAEPRDGVDASAPQFELRRALRAAGIVPGERVLLNWYRFDEIDLMNFDDVADFFRDIWYPSSDDLDIVDPDARWVVSIDHHGAVRVVHWPARMTGGPATPHRG